MPDRTYQVVSRYMEDGKWTIVSTNVVGQLYNAGVKASERAEVLDARFGGDHFWTVDIFHLDDAGERDGLGSYYQLFHGRLR